MAGLALTVVTVLGVGLAALAAELLRRSRVRWRRRRVVWCLVCGRYKAGHALSAAEFRVLTGG